MTEMLGFAGSSLIVVSLMMRSILPLRIVGLIGALAFASYGLLLDAWPVVATNTITSGLHIFHLRRLVPEHLAARRASDAINVPAATGRIDNAGASFQSS